MNRKVIAVVTGAVVLFAGGIVGALALTGNSGYSTPLRTMSDGSTTSGDGGSMDGTHTRGDGSDMPGMEMRP